MIKFNGNKFPHRYTYCWDNKEMGICVYVWKLLFTMVMFWLLAAVFGAVIGLVLIGMVIQGMILFTDTATFAIFLNPGDASWWTYSLFIFYIAVVLAALIGFTELLEKWRERRRYKAIANLNSKKTNDSVILEYIRAKKEKWCPTVRVI